MTPKIDWPEKAHPDMMTVADVAKRLKCSVSLVYALIDSGEMGCYRIGLGKQGGIRIAEEQIAAYLKNRESQGVAQGQPIKHLKLS